MHLYLVLIFIYLRHGICKIVEDDKNILYEKNNMNQMRQVLSNDDYSGIEHVREYKHSNVTSDRLLNFLINVSKQQLKNVLRNIKRDYQLTDAEILLIDTAFKNSDWEYKIYVTRYYKKKFANASRMTTRNTSSLSEFTDFTHFLIQQIIENNLIVIDSKFLLPSIWSKQTLKHKILRQQMKIVINSNDNDICWSLSLCMKRTVYTDYLVEWLRYLLNADADRMSNFFMTILPLLDQFMHVIRTNIKFRHRIKHLVHSDVSVQRDFVDFVDEIFTNQDEIIRMMPNELRKSTVIYLELFELIDDNYKLNNEAESRLSSISKMLYQWSTKGAIDIQKILDTIVHYMELNIKIWPLAEQKRMDFIWMQLLS